MHQICAVLLAALSEVSGSYNGMSYVMSPPLHWSTVQWHKKVAKGRFQSVRLASEEFIRIVTLLKAIQLHIYKISEITIIFSSLQHVPLEGGATIAATTARA